MGMRTRLGHGLGALPSKPNPNDLGFPAHLLMRGGEFPARAIISGTLGPVKDQGSQGSCTAHGATSEGERLYRRWKNSSPVFAPAFHYYLERKIEGSLTQGDCGAQVVTSLEIAENGGSGFCPESEMPYDANSCETAPSEAALAAAAANPGGSYHSLGNNIANMKSCILSDYSFVIGIGVYDSFESDHVEMSGLIPLPNLDREDVQGDHEMHCGIGFDDSIRCPNTKIPGAILGQNSWGDQWGTTCPIAPGRGFYWIPYEYLMNPALTSDVRMQHLGAKW